MFFDIFPKTISNSVTPVMDHIAHVGVIFLYEPFHSALQGFVRKLIVATDHVVAVSGGS